MYQLNIKITKDRAFWIYALNKLIASGLKQFQAIAVTAEIDGQLNLGLACESKDKAKMNAIVRDGLTELIETVGKMCYIDEKLSTLKLKGFTYKLLLHTLVAFDRECEREMLAKCLDLTPSISLDGIYNFKLSELKKRWDEVCSLINANASYLNDELTMNELLRFLVSAINPKILKLELKQSGEDFELKGAIAEKIFNLKTTGSENLLLYLIDLAPIELEICGEFEDNSLYCRLVDVFDAKQKKSSENIVTSR